MVVSYHVCPICNVGVFINARELEARLRELEARLRACAPVLAPAEDGRPSLAEWVHAAEGSALPPGRIGTEWMPLTNGKAQNWRMVRGHTEVEFTGGGAVIRVLGEAEVWCPTPAALRAALDALAVPVDAQDEIGGTASRGRVRT